MELGQKFADKPNSRTNPPGTATIKIIDRDQQKLVEHKVRFAYLDEFERISAEQGADKLADQQGWVDDQHRSQARRAFQIAAFLRSEKDVDVSFFMASGKASAGEVALRQLGFPSAVGTIKKWADWMEAEFLTDVTTGAERSPTEAEQAEMEAAARGES
jgi:hypothetical protein